MSTLSSANVMDANLVLKERTHMRLCINMLIFTHNLGNWPITHSHMKLCQFLQTDRHTNRKAIPAYTQHGWHAYR